LGCKELRIERERVEERSPGIFVGRVSFVSCCRLASREQCPRASWVSNTHGDAEESAHCLAHPATLHRTACLLWSMDRSQKVCLPALSLLFVSHIPRHTALPSETLSRCEP
jgi:hypothetical protein